jgi:hypothetical protein
MKHHLTPQGSILVPELRDGNGRSLVVGPALKFS